jgi:riboflavin kinase/FMN adenylyltransferase
LRAENRYPLFLILLSSRTALAELQSAKPFVIVTDPASPPERLAGAVVAIGNFDGIHRGHVAVIRRAEALARDLGCPCGVLTFEPHPSDYFRGPATIFRLTPRDAKAKALERLGIDGMIVFTFDAALAGLDARDFVAEILVRRLGVRAVVAGYDFHFGAGRTGTPDFLRREGERLGFVVEIVERVPAGAEDAAEAASSTATRAALEEGDVARAAQCLGHPFVIMGEVVAGNKLGRTLGFPTANIVPDPSCRLRHGIYAVRVEVDHDALGSNRSKGMNAVDSKSLERDASGKPVSTFPHPALKGHSFDAVASFGRRPTLDNGPALLEVVLFGFSGDLYGKVIEVSFVAWIRAEEKFPSLAALKMQIGKDCERAKAILGAHG